MTVESLINESSPRDFWLLSSSTIGKAPGSGLLFHSASAALLSARHYPELLSRERFGEDEEGDEEDEEEYYNEEEERESKQQQRLWPQQQHFHQPQSTGQHQRRGCCWPAAELLSNNSSSQLLSQTAGGSSADEYYDELAPRSFMCLPPMSGSSPDGDAAGERGAWEDYHYEDVPFNPSLFPSDGSIESETALCAFELLAATAAAAVKKSTRGKRV